MRTNLRSRIAAAVIGLCLAPGCRPDPVTASPQGSVGSSTEQAVAIAPVEHPAELLPASTVVYLVGESPRRAAEVFARDEIAQRFPDLYGRVGALSTSLFGRDVLDPKSLPAMGIDPDGRAGIAVLSVSSEAFALFVTLSDPPKFRETVLTLAARSGAELVPTSLGSGTEILRDTSGHGAVVIRGQYAVAVAGEGEDVPRIAEAMATVEPSRALAGRLAYRRTVGATAPGDLVGFVDPVTILQQSAERRAREGAMPNWAEELLEEARARADAPEQIAELEARAREEAQWRERRRARQDAEAAIAERLFSAVEGISFRVDAKPSGALVELRMPMGEDAFLRRLLRAGKGAPPLSWALDGAPLLLLSGNLDVDTAVELGGLFLRAEDKTYDELTAAWRNELGVDASAVASLLTGAMGGALTIDGKIDLAGTDWETPSWLGFAVHAEVSDPAAVTKLLEGAAAKLRPFGKPMRREAGTAELSFDVPGWRRVYVTVAGRHLVVTTDRLLPERIAKGKAGSVEKKTKPSAAYGAMSLPDASLTYATEMTLLSWGLLLGRSMASFPVETSVESPETASIPTSRTWQRKKKELEAATKRLREAERALDDSQAAAALDVMRPIGMTVLVAKLEEQGLWATGGQFVRADGIPGALLEVIAATQKLSGAEDTPEREKVDRLFEEVMRLQNELHAIREADVLRAQTRKR
jgi:hypothetical protein